MRIPDPKANTTTEAYLAYKAGYLEESELKPVLYEPYLHFDAWLAYWAGLVPMYPIKAPGKNLFNRNNVNIGSTWNGAVQSRCYPFYRQGQPDRAVYLLPVKPNTNYTVSLASSDWYVMEILDVDSNFTVLSKLTSTQENAFTTTITTGEHSTFLGFKFKYGSDGTALITKEMIPELKLQAELGDTATSYEDYTGEPEMLTDEEALVAHLSGVTDTYPEEIKDPYDVRIVGYLKHLASIRWPEPDYPVNNEEFYLSTMKPTHTSNSVPSSDIELDTAEGKIISVEAYGDTYQQTYKGINLLPPTANFQETVVDVNVLYENGVFTISGTATGSGGQSTTWREPIANYTIEEGDYWQYKNDFVSQQMLIQLRFTDNTTFAQAITTEDIIIDLSSYVGKTIKDYRLYFQSGYDFNGTMSPMIVKSSTSAAFEPYVGGAPVPNPDYPQNIYNVTGEQTVRLSGENLLPPPADFTQTVNGLTITCSGGEYTFIGNASSGTTTGVKSIIAEYTIQQGDYFHYNNSLVSPRINIGLRFSDNTQFATSMNSKNKIISLEDYVGKTVIGITVNFNNGYDFDGGASPMIVNGISTPIAFEPYQVQSYPISLGSTELCKVGDYQDYIYRDEDGDWYVHKATGKVVFDGSESWALSGLPNYLFNAPLSLSSTGPSSPLVSERFMWNGSAVASQQNAMYVNSSARMVFVNPMSNGTLIATNTDDWKTWLGSNNTAVYYTLATPTDTKITDATLVGQLEALAGADTYNGKTYIKVTATDPNLPALLKVEAYKY